MSWRGMARARLLKLGIGGVLLAGFLANVVSLVYAVYWHRPMLGDGAYWLFQLTAYHRLFYDGSFNRFFPVLWQLPAFAYLTLGHGRSIALAIRLTELGYSFHPVLSLALCAWLLRRKRRLAFIVFPLLSFATATQSTLAFSAGEAPDALSVFWPLFICICFQDPESIREAALILVLSACLAFCYEPSIAFFVANVLVVGWRIIFERPSRARPAIWFTLILQLAGFGWFAHELLGSHPVYQTEFLGELHAAAWGAYRKISVAAILAFGALSVLGASDRRVARSARVRRLLLGAGVFVCLAFLAVAVVFVRQQGFDIGETMLARVTALPFALVVAGWGWLALQLDPELLWLNEGPLGSCFVALLAVSLGGAAAHDWRNTRQWSHGVVAIRQRIEKAGCHLVPDAEFRADLFSAGMDDWTIQYLSILLSESRRVSSLLYVDSWARSVGNPDPCTALRSGKLVQVNGKQKELGTAGSFDFTPLLRQAGYQPQP